MSNIIDKLIVIFLGVLLPAKIYICIVGIVIAIDTYYGVKASKFKEEKFDWSRFLDGMIGKIKLYTPAVVAIYWLDMYVLSDIVSNWIPIELFTTRLVTVIVLSREFLSIDKHWETLTGRKVSQRANVVLQYFKHLRRKVKDVE